MVYKYFRYSKGWCPSFPHRACVLKKPSSFLLQGSLFTKKGGGTVFGNLIGREYMPSMILRNKVTVTSQKERGSAVVEAENVRNVGIMAHIDAGKTTTTERMLYYAGFIKNPGEVHHGDTVTDFLPQERERGITIQSAVVSFLWKNRTINLIDTPGHVDFTFEVQRSLRVVDSAVAILDTSAGVEAQTLTVWRQASDYNLPRLIYLNKMDKASASLDMSLESITAKLKCEPILIQEPVYSKKAAGSPGSGIVGLVDIVSMKRFIFDQESKGSNIIVDDLKDNKQLMKRRCELVEKVSDYDSDLATKIIENESTECITDEELSEALKRVTFSNNAVPVLLGSSYKNIGVQPLLDGILRFLPHPSELKKRDQVLDAYGKELCTFAFKTMFDKQLGPLTFTRIFRGTLESGQKIHNVTRHKPEKLGKIYRPFADEMKEVDSASAGQVVIVSGLKDTYTGDTLTSSTTVANSVVKKLKATAGKEDEGESIRAVLSGVSVPEPVFFCSVEPASISQQKLLDHALDCIQREDPSLHVHVDPDSSQTVLSGMGELHLEVIAERLKSDYKVDADLGKLQVAYKETIISPITKRSVFERRLADRKHQVIIEFEVIPTNGILSPKVRKGFTKDNLENITHVTERQMRLIQNGVDSALRCGPKLSFPVVNLDIVLYHLEVNRGTSETIVEAAAASCIRDCLQTTSIVFLEPFVTLEITVDEDHMHIVNDDLNRRRFLLESIDLRHGNKVITGVAPLSELLGYSTALRTISSGLGTYTMQFSHYAQINNPSDEDRVIREIRGF